MFSEEYDFLGISSVYSEEIPRKPKFWVFSEFPRKFVGIFRGSHFPSESPSELRCFLVVRKQVHIFCASHCLYPIRQDYSRERSKARKSFVSFPFCLIIKGLIHLLERAGSEGRIQAINLMRMA